MNRTPYFMAAPAAGLMMLLFAGGLAFAFAQSLGLFAATGDSAFTLRYYNSILQSPDFAASLSLTLGVSVAATLVSAFAALLVAVSLRLVALRQSWLALLVEIPVAIPHLSMAIALTYAIAPTDLLARIAHRCGLLSSPSAFPQFVHDGYGIGITILYVLKETPFLALLCMAVLARVDKDYYAAAQTLGASKWQQIRYVMLPLLTPALAGGSLAVFAFIFSAFEVPYLLGRPYPAMLGVLAQRKFITSDLTERPEGIALALLGAVVAIAAAWLARGMLAASLKEQSQ